MGFAVGVELGFGFNKVPAEGWVRGKRVDFRVCQLLDFGSGTYGCSSTKVVAL